MQTSKNQFQSIDEYIKSFPKDVQDLLEQLRQIIKAAAPEAEERISYAMPAFQLHGYLVYFGAAKDHIGFYPASSGIGAFKDKLANYDWSKGTIRFPLTKPLPVHLVTQIVKFRVKENLEKFNSKKNRRTTDRM